MALSQKIPSLYELCFVKLFKYACAEELHDISMKMPIVPYQKF